MIIRWLQCYGGSEFSLKEILDHELGELRTNGTKAVCAERLRRNADGKLVIGVPDRVKVGLLCKNSSVIRRYKEDVYSIRNETGYLKKTRKDCGGFGTHSELWVHPSSFMGIVIKERWKALSPEKREAIKSASLKYELPVFIFCNGGQLCKINVN